MLGRWRVLGMGLGDSDLLLFFLICRAGLYPPGGQDWLLVGRRLLDIFSLVEVNQAIISLVV